MSCHATSGTCLMRVQGIFLALSLDLVKYRDRAEKRPVPLFEREEFLTFLPSAMLGVGPHLDVDLRWGLPLYEIECQLDLPMGQRRRVLPRILFTSQRNWCAYARQFVSVSVVPVGNKVSPWSLHTGRWMRFSFLHFKWP